MRQGTWQSSNRSRSKSGPFSNRHSQQELGGFIHYLTVFLYIIFVSLPAAYLCFYYTTIWDPNYIGGKNLIMAQQNTTKLANFYPSRDDSSETTPQKCDCSLCPNKQPKITLQNILASVTSPKPESWN